MKRKNNTNRKHSESISRSHVKSNSSCQYSNINSYKHMLANPTINEKHLKWASQLRLNPINKYSSTLKAEAPQVYYKTIKAHESKHSSADIRENVNISEFAHLAMHRMGGQVSQSQLMFETSLREDTDKDHLRREKGWNCIPKKDRHEEARVIRTRSIKKKNIFNEDTEIAMDSSTNYPKFTEKIIKVKNYNQFRHMLRGEVCLPSIGWQTNLRAY